MAAVTLAGTQSPTILSILPVPATQHGFDCIRRINTNLTLDQPLLARRAEASMPLLPPAPLPPIGLYLVREDAEFAAAYHNAMHSPTLFPPYSRSYTVPMCRDDGAPMVPPPPPPPLARHFDSHGLLRSDAYSCSSQLAESAPCANTLKYGVALAPQRYDTAPAHGARDEYPGPRRRASRKRARRGSMSAQQKAEADRAGSHGEDSHGEDGAPGSGRLPELCDDCGLVGEDGIGAAERSDQVSVLSAAS